MIKSLIRALELLEILKENTHRYSIAELSETTGMPPSTVHRMLQTFADAKYVSWDEATHTYELGPALISLGRAAAGNFKIQDISLPILRRLSSTTREDSFLIIQSGDKGLVLSKQDGPNHLKIVEEFGYELDLHCGAIRKVLLAYQKPDYIRYYLDSRLDRPDAFPQISRKGLERELQEIRRNGIAVTYGEYVHDAVGIGAPVFGSNGQIAASVGLIAPVARIPDEQHLTEAKNHVKNAAMELSYYLGAQQSDGTFLK